MSDILGRVKEVRDIAHAAANGTRVKQAPLKDVADLLNTAIEGTDEQWKQAADALARDHGVSSISPVYARITAEEWARMAEVEAIRAGRVAHG